MSKLTKQNVDGVDFSMVGCALTGTCFSAASDFIKVVNLTDGDVITDGMSVVITFSQPNTAGNAPAGQTVYSSDQITYYYDAGLTNPVTLPPAGCYHVIYTGTGNAYTLYTYPVITAGGVTAPLCASDGRFVGGSLWNAVATVIVLYTGGKFIICNGAADKMRIVNSGSADDLIKVGFYTGLDLTNAPVSGWVDYIVTCLNNDPNYANQLAFQGDKIFQRYRDSIGWKEWGEISRGKITTSNTGFELQLITTKYYNNTACNTAKIYGTGTLLGLATFIDSIGLNGRKFSGFFGINVGTGSISLRANNKFIENSRDETFTGTASTDYLWMSSFWLSLPPQDIGNGLVAWEEFWDNKVTNTNALAAFANANVIIHGETWL